MVLYYTVPGQCSPTVTHGCGRSHCSATAKIEATVHAPTNAAAALKTRLWSSACDKRRSNKTTDSLDKPTATMKKMLLVKYSFEWALSQTELVHKVSRTFVTCCTFVWSADGTSLIDFPRPSEHAPRTIEDCKIATTYRAHGQDKEIQSKTTEGGERLTVAAARHASSMPMPGLTPQRINNLMAAKSNVQVRPRAVAMMSHAVWSVSVTTAKGGEYPGGILRPELEPDITNSEAVNS